MGFKCSSAPGQTTVLTMSAKEFVPTDPLA
jgi:hypothetical protein